MHDSENGQDSTPITNNENTDKNSKTAIISAETKVKIKKILSVTGTVITAIILLFTAFIVVNIVIARSQNRNVSLLGYSFGIVQTPSMEPDISVGDLIIYKSCDISEAEVKDIIVFKAGEGFGQISGQNVIHRVIGKVTVGDNIQLTTKGDNNLVEDTDKVTSENFLGLCIFYSSFWGWLFTFLSKYGIIILVLIIAVPFIVKQIKKIIKLANEGEK